MVRPSTLYLLQKLNDINRINDEWFTSNELVEAILQQPIRFCPRRRECRSVHWLCRNFASRWLLVRQDRSKMDTAFRHHNNHHCLSDPSCLYQLCTIRHRTPPHWGRRYAGHTTFSHAHF